jgi:hypothetical protein
MAPLRQMDAAMTMGVGVGMQQRRHALEQGEQDDEGAAMERSHGAGLDQFRSRHGKQRRGAQSNACPAAAGGPGP